MRCCFASDSAPNESPVNLDDEYTRERAVVRITSSAALGGRLESRPERGARGGGLAIDREGVQVRDDRLRVFEAGRTCRAGTWVKRHSSSANLELRQGLDALGAGLQASDLANDRRRSDFLLVLLQASSFTRLRTTLVVPHRCVPQQTGYVLPDSERFKIGGDRLGRGFEVAEIAGDQGAGAKLELRRELTPAGPSSAAPRSTASTTSAPPGNRIFRGANRPPPQARVSACKARV